MDIKYELKYVGFFHDQTKDKISAKTIIGTVMNPNRLRMKDDYKHLILFDGIISHVDFVEYLNDIMSDHATGKYQDGL